MAFADAHEATVMMDIHSTAVAAILDGVIVTLQAALTQPEIDAVVVNMQAISAHLKLIGKDVILPLPTLPVIA